MSTNVQVNLLSGLSTQSTLGGKDVYLQMSLGEEQSHISSIKQVQEGKAVSWNENYHFQVHDDLRFEFTLWDYDPLMLNDDATQNVLGAGQVVLSADLFINASMTSRQVHLSSAQCRSSLMVLNLQFKLINDSKEFFRRAQKQVRPPVHVQQVRHYQNQHQVRYQQAPIRRTLPVHPQLGVTTSSVLSHPKTLVTAPLSPVTRLISTPVSTPQKMSRSYVNSRSQKVLGSPLASPVQVSPFQSPSHKVVRHSIQPLMSPSMRVSPQFPVTYKRMA